MTTSGMHVDCPQCDTENLRGYPSCWKCGYPLIPSTRRKLSVEELHELLAQANIVDAQSSAKPHFWQRLLPQRFWRSVRADRASSAPGISSEGARITPILRETQGG
jgi:hypothetical protein